MCGWMDGPGVYVGLVGGKGFRLMRGSMQVSLIGTFLLNNAN